MRELRTDYPAVSMDNVVVTRSYRTRVFRHLPHCSTKVFPQVTRYLAVNPAKGLFDYGIKKHF